LLKWLKLIDYMSNLRIASQLGASVRSFRHGLGLSQEELAERAQLHRTYIAGIESGGRNLTLKNIEKLAHALQVSTNDLLPHSGGKIAPPPTLDGKSGSEFLEILMVEDNPDDAELTLQAFKLSRITNPVRVLQNGEDAMDYLFRRGAFSRRGIGDQPQLVLLDLKLPKISGLEVLRAIKAHGDTRLIPVVVLTTSQNHRDIAECRRLGAETYIVKPVDFQSLSLATPQLGLEWTLLKPAESNSFSPQASLPR